MWILIGVTAALLVCDRVLKALARSEKLRYRGKLLQLTYLENPVFFLGKGSRYPRLLRWVPLGIWLLAAALLLPDVERETAAISQKLGRGRHTTREVTIFEAYGGRIADTPGFASLEANRAGFIPKENLEHAFPEFGPYLGQCQFTGCSHRSEKGCAVRAALAEGKLSQTRYDSYCAMYDEVKDVKDWQRPKV